MFFFFINSFVMQIHTEKQMFTAYAKPQNHRVVWDGRDIQDLLVPTPMP